MNDLLLKKAGRTTLKEVARLAGVSVSTASLVLSGKGAERRISADAERRVREIAREHDYTPNLLVRSMQRGRTYILSFYNAFEDHRENDLYMDRLSAAIARAAGQHQYDVLVHCDFTRPADETYRMLNGGRADGLIFFGPHHDNPLLVLLRESRLPTLILNHVDEESVLSSVSEDMQSGMRQIAEELVRLGHTCIAAISDGPGTDAPVRIAALRAQLAVYGVALPEGRVVSVPGGEPVLLENALRHLRNEPEPPTALFCWHDRIGYRVLEVCEKLGIAVPGDLSLMGYDGLHWPSTSQHMLASVDVHLDTLVEAAVSLLNDIILGNRAAPARQVFPVSLTRGTTLAAPRTAA